MSIYYQDDKVTLHLGDCREVTDWLAADLLLTDPPYGMNYDPRRGGDGSKRWGTDRVLGDDQAFDPEHLLSMKRAVLFGANWYASRLPDSGGWVVWDKTPKGFKQGFTASHAELAWTNITSSVRKVPLQWGGEARNGEGHFHPTQKPVGLLRTLIEWFSEPGETIADPYAGSGSTLLAAREAGRSAIGVELREDYCEVIAKRLAQDCLDLEVTA